MLLCALTMGPKVGNAAAIQDILIIRIPAIHCMAAEGSTTDMQLVCIPAT